MKPDMPYIDAKLLIIILALLVLALLLIRHRQRILMPLAVAFTISLLWSLYFRYEYIGNNIFLFDRLNVYPLILWTVGLTTLQAVSFDLPQRYRRTLTIIIYLAFLMTAEATGYYLLDIRLNSRYTSLLSLGVIHAPIMMKIFYIFAGPVYIALLDYLATKYQPVKQL